MDVELSLCPKGRRKELWQDFLRRMGLEPDENVERTALVWDSGELIATGSRQSNILKCIAVDPAHQGEGLTATVLTALRQDAFTAGHSHLFLYTKPKNRWMFESLFFYPVAQTADVLLMENRKNGVGEFLQTLPKAGGSGVVGAAVMNCNPFTLGHRYLIEKAAGECEHMYVFVLSEDRSEFSAADRLEMVRRGTADLANVTVLPTGPYLISSATFPTYFLKEREKATEVQCALDIQVFSKHYAPYFGINRRYVGTEPLSPMTGQYNEALKALLPQAGIQLNEIPRLETGGEPVSASRVRKLLAEGNWELLSSLLPQTTLNFLNRR